VDESISKKEEVNPKEKFILQEYNYLILRLLNRAVSTAEVIQHRVR
jgi:hypothetical protein